MILDTLNVHKIVIVQKYPQGGSVWTQSAVTATANLIRQPHQCWQQNHMINMHNFSRTTTSKSNTFGAWYLSAKRVLMGEFCLGPKDRGCLTDSKGHWGNLWLVILGYVNKIGLILWNQFVGFWYRFMGMYKILNSCSNVCNLPQHILSHKIKKALKAGVKRQRG